MTREETITFLTRHETLWRNRDWKALAAAHAEDGIVISPMFATVKGRPAIEQSYKNLFTAFADWHFISQEIIVDGDSVAQVFTGSATHTQEFFGLPGTGRRFESQGVLMLKFENGLIKYERRYYDFSGLLIQLGVLKAKPV